MELKDKIKRDQAIMKVLKASRIRYEVCKTNLGPLDLAINFGDEQYQLFLDATPLDKEDNDKLLALFELL